MVIQHQHDCDNLNKLETFSQMFWLLQFKSFWVHVALHSYLMDTVFVTIFVSTTVSVLCYSVSEPSHMTKWAKRYNQVTLMLTTAENCGIYVRKLKI